MTSKDARTSGCTRYTPFEEELVNAMRNFANKTDAPEFDSATIMRGARHRRSLVTAGIVAVLALVLGGGAAALAVTQGSPATGYPSQAPSPRPVVSQSPVQSPLPSSPVVSQSPVQSPLPSSPVVSQSPVQSPVPSSPVVSP
jgi:hypothetical protein